MNPLIWHKVAGISGVAALGLGTYGAHFFKPQNPTYKDVWQTASLYHLVHTAALVSAPIAKYPNVFGGLLTAGIVAFSGTLCSINTLDLKALVSNIDTTLACVIIGVHVSSVNALVFHSLQVLYGCIS
ncbi:unnamed protein product [Trifolium pratense]|uniref:Uncharacterized protein n=1 Tax=Trifolium pratense TaxID=57577 RepID=A0ACB0K8N1_TRIPR|nr:unnamed protein product [Trifolium pratense]